MAMNQATSSAVLGMESLKSSDGGRFFKMLAASLLVHAFLTPFPALFGLIAMLPALKVSDDAEIIEIELTSLPVAPTAQAPAHPEEQVVEPEEVPPQPEIDESEAEEATVPQPDPDETNPPQPEVKAAPPAPAEQVAPNELYADPIALAGRAAQIADSNANVRLFIFADVIRAQPLGERIGGLLRRTPQWSDFFGPADIDPIRDVDRVLIAGPQLRNSSQVVAVVQHHLPPAIIDAAFKHLVERKGEWIDKEAKLARAEADRASRIFAAPNDSVVVVAPPQMEAQLRGLGEHAKFSRADGDIALSAYIVTPHRVARGTGIELPKSIKWARFDLRPTADGGGVLKILAQDEDQEHAKENAQFFQMLIDQVSTIDLRRGGGFGAVASLLLGSQKVRMLKEATFKSKDDQIEGTIVATAAQLMNVADLLDAFLPPPSSTAERNEARKATPSEGTSRQGIEGRDGGPLVEGATKREDTQLLQAPKNEGAGADESSSDPEVGRPQPGDEPAQGPEADPDPSPSTKSSAD